jgi:hypothetical protein
MTIKESTMNTKTDTSGMNFEALVTTTELGEVELGKVTGGGGGTCSGGCGTGPRAGVDGELRVQSFQWGVGRIA